MPRVDIRGTRGEVTLVASNGVVSTGEAAMDEIMVSITRDGDNPIALSFEDVQDMGMFTIDLGVDQAENLARELLSMVGLWRSSESTKA